MKIKAIVSILIIIILRCTASLAQKQWTLEECIEHALKNNLQIRQAENNYKLSDQNLLQSKGTALPNLNASGTHNYNFGRNIDPFTNQFTNSQVQSNNFAINSNLVLFQGSQVRNTIKQSRYEYMATGYQVETLKNDIALNIAAAYLDILFNKELTRNAENQLNLTKQQLTRTEQLVSAGTLSPAVVFDLKAQIASEEAQLTRNQNNVILSYLNLSQLLDLPGNEPFEILQPEGLLIPSNQETLANPDDVVKTALNNQPQVKVSEYRRLSTIKALQAAKGRQSPRLVINGSLSTLYSSSSKVITGSEFTGYRYIGFTQSTLDSVLSPTYQNVVEQKSFNSQLKDNYNRFFGLTLSIPILNGLQTRTAIERARLNVSNAELDLRISKLNVEKNVRKAHVDATTSLSNYNASESSVTTSSEALANAEKRFNAGLLNAFEYNQSKTRVSLAQSDLLRAKYDYIFKLKIIDFYKGIPFKL